MERRQVLALALIAAMVALREWALYALWSHSTLTDATGGVFLSLTVSLCLVATTLGSKVHDKISSTNKPPYDYVQTIGYISMVIPFVFLGSILLFSTSGADRIWRFAIYTADILSAGAIVTWFTFSWGYLLWAHYISPARFAFLVMRSKKRGDLMPVSKMPYLSVSYVLYVPSGNKKGGEFVAEINNMTQLRVLWSSKEGVYHAGQILTDPFARSQVAEGYFWLDTDYIFDASVIAYTLK